MQIRTRTHQLSKDQTVNKVETPDAKNSEKEIQVQKVSVSDKKAESAKLPNTGEEQSTSIALLGAVLGMFGLAGLSKTQKKTKTKLGDLDIFC